jgi:hypothetical protein
MRKHYFTIGIAAFMLFVGDASRATAKTRHLSCTHAGSVVGGVETHIDTNGDQISAGATQGIENCKGFRFLLQTEVEWLAPVPATGNCPAGTTLEFSLVQGHTVRTEVKTGDQLFWELSDATLCLKIPEFTFSFTGAATFEGGTGRFSGATGTLQIQATGSYLVTGRKEGIFGAFGQFTGTSTETLILPTGKTKDQ